MRGALELKAEQNGSADAEPSLAQLNASSHLGAMFISHSSPLPE